MGWFLPSSQGDDWGVSGGMPDHFIKGDRREHLPRERENRRRVQCSDAAGRCFVDRRLQVTRPLPGALETLALLREGGVRLALLTNGEGVEQRRKVSRFGLSRFFQTVLVEGDLGFGKPDPRIFQLALERLGVQANKTWIVGDSLEWEILGARMVGATGIWVDCEGLGLPSAPPAAPHRIVRAISELVAIGAAASRVRHGSHAAALRGFQHPAG